ncbi:MAG TPA: TlyA family RNA methyltransferase [Acidimicrobiales bacterium]|nr:TlyA family RNA methyltransferase [Acidimicrobiales bacterium]
MSQRRRLDSELVRRGLAPSREAAREAVEAGKVTVGGAPAAKPARLVAADEAIVVAGPPPRFVGRGGEKLDAAVVHFAIPVAGRRALDAGASTGGFTDCLLQHGALEVVAVDVGHGQLDDRLRRDARVRVMERRNIRHVTSDDVGGPFDLVTADLSFISLRTVLPQLVALLAGDGDGVLLVKPQFEAGRAETSRGGGVIRDPAVWRRVLDEVRSALSACGAIMMGVMVSPLRGADGNVEFLAHVSLTGEAGVTDTDLDAVIVAAGRGA